MSRPDHLVHLNDAEIMLAIEALAKSASRHESQARAVRFGRRHDETAAAMRALRFRLSAARNGQSLGKVA
jgi:hypothetical protein